MVITSLKLLFLKKVMLINGINAEVIIITYLLLLFSFNDSVILFIT